MWSKMFPEVWDTILAPLRGFAIPYPRHPRLAPWAAFLRRFAADPTRFMQSRSIIFGDFRF
jgi:hypothetical protein